MTNDNENPSPDYDLDQVIGQALQVDSDPQRLARLKHYWQVMSQRQRRRQRIRRTMALAAAMLFAVAAFSIRRDHQESKEFAQATRESSPPRDESAPSGPPLSDVGQSAQSSHSAGRPPTAYERLQFAARTRRRIPATSAMAGVDQAINLLMRDAGADARQAIIASGLRSFDAETLLLQRVRGATIAQQMAIVRLLAECGTRRSAPVLLQFARRDAFCDDALHAIAKIAGIDDLTKVVQRTRDRKLKAAIIVRLLTSGSKPALLGYLSLVGNAETRSEALAIANATPELPTEALIAFLDDERGGVRLSAAIVLGHVNGPEIARLLIARITSRPADSTETWMALLACRGDRADEFLDYAMQQPRLLGHCNYARLQWAQMIP